MKKYFKDIVFLSIINIFLLFIINNSQYVSVRVIYSFKLWLYKIVPTMLPTFIIVDLLFANRILSIIKKYLHIDLVFIISIISGSPTNAYILNKSNDDLTYILATTKFTGLIFTYISLYNVFDKRVSILLIIINILCNLILFFVFRPCYRIKIENNKKIIDLFLYSIQRCMLTLLNILGLIVFFNIIPINMIHNSFIKGLLYSLCEVTSSFDYLYYCTLPYHIKLLLSIISLSTCGACISMQIKSIISDTRYNYKKYLKIRLCHLVMYLLFGLILI